MYSPISHPGRLAVAVTSARGIGSAIYAACGKPPPLTPTLSAFTLLSALRPPPPLVKEMTGRIEVRSQVASARARSRTAAGPHREREEPDATYSGPIVQLHRISSRRRTDRGSTMHRTCRRLLERGIRLATRSWEGRCRASREHRGKREDASANWKRGGGSQTGKLA